MANGNHSTPIDRTELERQAELGFTYAVCLTAQQALDLLDVAVVAHAVCEDFYEAGGELTATGEEHIDALALTLAKVGMQA